MRCVGALLLLFLFAGCKSSGPYTICLVVLGKMKADDVLVAREQFTTMFPGKRVVVDTLMLDMPEDAYYKPRNRYRAEKILPFLRKHKGNHDYIGAVTALPISTTAHGHQDYGICGLSYTEDGISVTSSHHLDREMYLQVVRHEWGHGMLGIEHCKHPKCTMNAANGKAENLRGHLSFTGECEEKFNKFYKNMN